MRTFWEEYVGWFKLRSTTELYPDSAESALAELIDAAGVDAALVKADEALARGDAPLALRIGEAIAASSPDDPRLRALMANAHRYLLNNGGDESFWEEGWLRTELARWESQAND